MYRVFRTNQTSLTDDQLVLLDVLFDKSTDIDSLRSGSQGEFYQNWNLGYSHTLNDSQLYDNVLLLKNQGIIELVDDTSYRMTGLGGQLWSQERCPDWDRFIRTRCKCTENRTVVRAMSVSPRIVAAFLKLFPCNPPRCRTFTIPDPGLIHWYPLGQLSVGVGIYQEDNNEGSRLLTEEIMLEIERERLRWDRIERERCWWSDVRELQRFVPKAVNV